MLEQVEIDEGHGKLQVITLGTADLLLEGDVQEAVIVKAGQIIAIDQLLGPSYNFV